MPGQTQLREANVDAIALLTLAAASTNQTGNDNTNPWGKGLTVVVDITAITGAGATMTVVIEGKDPVSGKYYTLLTSAALAAVATTVLRVDPRIPGSANVTAQLPMPKTWRVRATIAGTTPAVTANVSATLHI